MTPERMSWRDDERLYQPGIHSRRIRQLHRISEETGEPMTVLVDQALAELVEPHGSDETMNVRNLNPAGYAVKTVAHLQTPGKRQWEDDGMTEAKHPLPPRPPMAHFSAAGTKTAQFPLPSPCFLSFLG